MPERVSEANIGITDRYEIYLEPDRTKFLFIDVPLVLDSLPDP
jgi:hypothetical protein